MSDVKTETYAEAWRRMVEEKREDYRRASDGQISWRAYAARWGIN